MSPDFLRAFGIVIGEEGGYANNPQDPGRETKFGISKRAYPSLDIAALTLDDAEAIYLRDFWTLARCDEIPWPLCLFVFDAAVNQGVGPAITLLQKSLGLPQDGSFGPQTRAAVAKMGASVGPLYMADRALRYTGTRNFDTFGRGWLKRLFGVAIKAT